MSIFSSLRKSRRQAKEHAAKVAEQKRQEEAGREPYRHVPTHAAADAIACAPPSWREQSDRPKILEQNRRRSAMAAAGHNMSIPGIPRVGSSLSHVSYPGEQVPVAMRLPRAQSYTNMYPYQNRGDVIYSMPDASLSQASWKGKEVNRQYAYGYDTPRISPTPSKDPHTREHSSTGSTSSQDELEMKPTTRTADAAPVHRLHPSHSRRTSDASDKQYTTAPIKPVSTSHQARPPPTTRGRPTFITGSASVPALSSSPNGMSSRPPVTNRHSFNNRDSLKTVSFSGGDLAVEIPSPPSSRRTSRDRRTRSRMMEMERVDSVSDEVAAATDAALSTDPDVQVRVYREQQLVTPPEEMANVFPEATYVEPKPAPTKNKRLSKVQGGSKPAKKNRWSFSRRAEVAV
ncbi:hypothetical protein VHEMI04593 [[Torrubiella] hemipterigena]|uniref:Uncharacterized protein n=1 Tax=[Torrubiella] hemipterigena TaxID=1531966 RepID=A0A0A1SVR6_9HYPO|nr:hypothetical protein VHEMI04593 [[Torrubiella] hemipterigena]